VRELTPLTPDLESVFLELTGGAQVPRQVDEAGHSGAGPAGDPDDRHIDLGTVAAEGQEAKA
jgi:ABC-2 type transport system ATP-binding protein